MKVLLTGKSGYISKGIISQVSKFNHEIIPVSIRDKKEFNELPDSIDVIIHTAAISDANSKNLSSILKSNYELTKDLYLFYKDRGLKHFLFFSSIKATLYDQRSLPDVDSDTISCPYAYSKAKAEYFLENQNDGVYVSIVRPSMVYSSIPKKNMRRLLKLCDTLLPLPLSNMSVVKNICHLDNLVELTRFLVQNPSYGVYTLSDVDSPTLTKLIESIRFELGRKRMLFAFPSIIKVLLKLLRPNLHSSLFLHEQSIDNKLPIGFEPVMTASEGVKMMVKTYKSN